MSPQGSERGAAGPPAPGPADREERERSDRADLAKLGEGLARFADATGLCVSAYDGTLERWLGPLASSRMTRLLEDAGAWEIGGAARAIEVELAAAALTSGERVTRELGEGLLVMALPITHGERRLGAIVFGWVFRSFSTSRASQRIAAELGINPGRFWGEVRLEPPVSAERLRVSAELLATLVSLSDQFRQTVERLHEAARSRETFLAFVSHELRTPLAALSSRIDILLHGPLDDPQATRAQLQRMQRHVHEEARLVEDLIDAARTRTGQLKLDRRPTVLWSALELAIEAVRPLADAKSIRIEAAAHGDVATLSILADPDRMQQVFWNLLTNAIKFTPAGGRVDVTAERAARTLEIRVADTGSGIAAEVLPTVFEPFIRQSAGNAQGLGLGLAIARSIVEQHGGSLGVRSDGSGRGATFQVALPCDEVPTGGTRDDAGR